MNAAWYHAVFVADFNIQFNKRYFLRIQHF